MIMQEAKLGSVDSLRFLDNIHTTTRQLNICTEIIRTLGKSSLPLNLLEIKLINWSYKKEQIDPDYKSSFGKLTESGKKTTALNHYLKFCEELGFIKSVGNFYSNTRNALVLLNLLPTTTQSFQLSSTEKLIYLFWLLSKDADGLLLTISITSFSTEINQSTARKSFLKYLNERLLMKQNYALPIARQTINEKYRIANFIWKNAESYAEHIIVPRYEWLSQLGLIEVHRKSGNTYYSLSGVGVKFYQLVPSLEIVKDINEEWIASHFFATLNKLDGNSKESIQLLDEKRKVNLVGETISKAIDNIKSSTSFKAPLFDTVLYSCFYLYLNMNTYADINEILQVLRAGISHGYRNFRIKESARINESYLLYQ